MRPCARALRDPSAPAEQDAIAGLLIGRFVERRRTRYSELIFAGASSLLKDGGNRAVVNAVEVL